MTSAIFHLKGIIESLLQWVQTDYESYPDEKDSWLYQFAHYDELETEKELNEYYSLIKEIFLRDESKRNKLSVTLEFPKDTTLLPVVVLREPSRQEGDSNVVSMLASDLVTNENGLQMNIFRDSKVATYDLMCIGWNYTETLLISEVLYGLLVAANDTLSRQYEKISYSLREVMVNQEMNPFPILIRTIGITLQQTNAIPSIVRSPYLDSIKFKHNALKK